MSLNNKINKIRDIVACNKVVPAVTVIAVTKTLNLAQTEEAINAGLINLGENRLQSALPKIEALVSKYPDIVWHFLGPIQKNKAKKIVDNFSYIHSIDSWEVLESINDYAGELKKQPAVLLQINVSNETSKHGFEPEFLLNTISRLQDFSNVRFEGYMTMAPFTQDKNVLHKVFSGLKIMAEKIKERGIEYKNLSMGMSNDYIIALKEGASMLRLGTILFS